MQHSHLISQVAPTIGRPAYSNKLQYLFHWPQTIILGTSRESLAAGAAQVVRPSSQIQACRHDIASHKSGHTLDSVLEGSAWPYWEILARIEYLDGWRELAIALGAGLNVASSGSGKLAA